ncbi:AAA family ATPase [Falsiroseomonas tokyonensis]|uniref:AAA family ATPase n=1 Tax=Falsiroseomonas tokyonensis TaxID=430521 RepID=UPI001C201676
MALLAFATDDETEATLRAGLSDTVEAMPVRRGGIRAAIRALERERTPRVLVVDLCGEGDPIGALDALAAVCEPDVTLLVTGEQSDIGFYRDLTRDLGVAEYLHKPLTRESVARVFGPRVAGMAEAPAHRGSRIVTVCGVRGGVGATTIAVNLALQVAETTHGHVGLLDLHLRGGTAAMMLGLRCSAGLRVALENPDRVDALFLERASVLASDRLRLLAADEPPEAEIAPKPEGVTRLLDLLRARCSIVVVDLPYPPGPMERQVLSLARQRVLVLGPDLAGARDLVAARKLLAGLQGNGPVLTVLNRAGAPGTLPLNMMQEGLGGLPDVVVPDLPKQLPRAANLGRPALHDSAALRKALAPLALEVGGTRPHAASRSWLGRLRERIGR